MDRQHQHHTDAHAGSVNAATLPRELGGMPGLALWWLLSFATVWEGIRMAHHDTSSPRMRKPPRRPPTVNAPSSLEHAVQWAQEGAQLRRVMDALLGVTAWAKPPKSTTQASALRGFLLATTLLFLFLAWY